MLDFRPTTRQEAAPAPANPFLKQFQPLVAGIFGTKTEKPKPEAIVEALSRQCRTAINRGDVRNASKHADSLAGIWTEELDEKVAYTALRELCTLYFHAGKKPSAHIAEIAEQINKAIYSGARTHKESTMVFMTLLEVIYEPLQPLERAEAWLTCLRRNVAEETDVPAEKDKRRAHLSDCRALAARLGKKLENLETAINPFGGRELEAKYKQILTMEQELEVLRLSIDATARKWFPKTSNNAGILREAVVVAE